MCMPLAMYILHIPFFQIVCLTFLPSCLSSAFFIFLPMVMHFLSVIVTRHYTKFEYPASKVEETLLDNIVLHI